MIRATLELTFAILAGFISFLVGWVVFGEETAIPLGVCTMVFFSGFFAGKDQNRDKIKENYE